MTEDIVITAKGLRKVYKLYAKPMDRLREILFRKQYHNEFVALDRIDISVKKGETLGIIGENGAGKSTLLKIVARTLKPTDGEVNIKGMVSSLLELGSGFHPEFTGIDNIYFYGSLTGISHEEMKEKITEIISFAEIGEHINYPIKTYSSGMYVRLAFSVATAIDPDILVIDEALSVGDLHFQKKSTDRIMSFKEEGKTIVFCSHNMYHVTRLCDRVLWFKNGRIYMEDSAFEVVQAYETYQLEKNNDLTDERSITAALESPAASDMPVDKEKKHIFIKDIQLSPFQNIRTGSDLTVKMKIVTEDNRLSYRIAVKIRRVDGLDIVGIGTNDYEPFKGDRTIGIRFPDIQLREGTFFIEAFVFDENFLHIFDIKSSEPFVVPKESLELGIVRLPHEWLIN